MIGWIRNRRLLVGHVLAISLLSPLAIRAQEEDGRRILMDNKPAFVVGQLGSALVLWSEEIPIARSAWDRQDQLRYQWYMVQDSSLSLVFEEPSGIRGALNADLDLQALARIRAFEVRAMVFSVFDEPLRTLSFTTIEDLEEGKKVNYNPTWYDLFDESSRVYSSVMWVSRVRLEDGTIIVADTEPVLMAARLINDGVVLQDLSPQPVVTDSIRAIGGGP